MSLKLRLAILVAVLGLLQAAGVLAFSYVTFERELQANSRHVLRDKALQARHLIDEMQDATAVKANAFRLVELVTGHAELHMAVASSDTGEVYVAFSPEASESLQRLKHDTWETNAFLSWQAKEKGTNMLSLATASKTRNGLPYEIVLTTDRSKDVRLMRELLLTAATAAPIALGLVFLAALIVVSLGLKPLQRFKRAVGSVSATTLTERLDTSGYTAELQELAHAFNLMVQRLDDGVTRLSQFSGDLAHEMRTPLATVLGRTQVALSKSRSVEQLTDVLENNIEELQRLSRLVSDMLFLAQADYAQNVLNLQPVALEEEATRVAEFLDVVAQERQVSITVEGNARILADKGLVQRAITNLLTNAVRHCTAATVVRVHVQAHEGVASLDVVNQGTPIEPQHLSHLFDRFYRVDSARGRDEGGAGLGLAIVKAIMALHGGTAKASTTSRGDIRFSLSFPNQSIRSGSPHAAVPSTRRRSRSRTAQTASGRLSMVLDSLPAIDCPIARS